MISKEHEWRSVIGFSDTRKCCESSDLVTSCYEKIVADIIKLYRHIFTTLLSQDFENAHFPTLFQNQFKDARMYDRIRSKPGFPTLNIIIISERKLSFLYLKIIRQQGDGGKF